MGRQHGPEQVTHPLHVAQQAAMIGGASAIPGTIVGSFFGTLRTQTPVLFSLVSGAQWFAIGTTFWSVRTSILHSTGLINFWNVTRGRPLRPRHDLNPSQSDRIRASTIAGAITGSTLGLLFRGPRNVIPGTLMFSLFGWAGQHGYHYLDQSHTEQLQKEAELAAKGEVEEKPNLLQRIAKSKYSPMSKMTDEEYKKTMQEKILYIDAQIAAIDERLEEFQKSQQEQQVNEQKK